MYFWSPHWAQPKYDLVEVELPRSTTSARQRGRTPTRTGTRATTRTTCSTRRSAPDLETKAPAAFEFLSNFSWTAEDQNAVGVAINDGDGPGWRPRRVDDANEESGSPGSTPGCAASVVS